MEDKLRLIEILENARRIGIEIPPVPEWAKGTFFERQAGAFIEVPDVITDDLTKIFAQNPDLEVFNDRLFYTGYGASRVNYKMLSIWLLWRTLEIGPQKTVEDLERFTKIEGTPAYQILAISGIEVDKSIELGNDISLVPFASVPESRAKYKLTRQASIHQKELMSPFVLSLQHDKSMYPGAALIRKISISPKSYKQDEDSPSSTPKMQDLYEVCQCLTLVGPSAPAAIGEWGTVEDWVPLSKLFGCGFSSLAFNTIASGSSYRFRNEDYELAKDTVHKYLDLSQTVQSDLRVPLQRLNQSLRRQSLVDKFIDLAISLEALLLHECKDKEQLSLTFRLRGAWLLGKEANERMEYHNLFRAIYDARSSAVHSGKIDYKKLKKPPQEVFDRGANACVAIMKHVIDNRSFPETPDWTKLILDFDEVQ